MRAMVGTLVEIGRGRLAPGDMPAIMAARSRSAAGPAAPACGLYLAAVHYLAHLFLQIGGDLFCLGNIFICLKRKRVSENLYGYVLVQ